MTRAVAKLMTWLLAACWAGLSPAVFGQASMLTLRTNGPAANRFNIVFLSEGYTASEMPQYLMDATNALNALLSRQPFSQYSSYFNAFAIKTNSAESGSDHPYDDPPTSASTYFNSCYDGSLITLPAGSNGQGRVDALLQTFMPKCSLSVLLVNDPAHDGGSDGFDKTAIVANGYDMAEYLAHETGHVVANLGDEYDDSYPGFPDTEEPNTTQETNRAKIKWHAWISPGTPIPTSPAESYPSAVGLFEGAHYHTTGWYRPKLNCLMRYSYSAFCDVCSEALVLAFYSKVRPVDAFFPANTNLSVANTQALSFNLTLLQPPTNTLCIQWSTNGEACSGATNLEFSLLPDSLPNGTNLIRALVRDNTSLVRTDPANLLCQTIVWTLNVNLPRLRLDSPARLPGGRFAFRVTGNAPQGFAIQCSTNFLSWLRLSTNSLASGQFWYTNSGADTNVRTFYRAVTPP